MEVAAEELVELGCVLIPLQEQVLLLPNVSVAEILPWRRVRAVNDVPPWCLGLLGWRGEAIPVVRFEVINGSQNPVRKTGRCLIVMNRARSGVPFYAIAAEGLPRMLQLNVDDISSDTRETGPAESVVVQVGTEAASIPDLDFIESEVAKLARPKSG